MGQRLGGIPVLTKEFKMVQGSWRYSVVDSDKGWRYEDLCKKKTDEHTRIAA